MSEQQHFHEKGSCLCGAVTFEVTGDFQRFFLCHCSRCRKVTGSAHVANIFVGDAKLTWLSGEDHISRYAHEGTRFAKWFCDVCGSALPRSTADGTNVVVPAGALDTDFDQPPTGHIFMGSKAVWDHDLTEAPKFDERP